MAHAAGSKNLVVASGDFSGQMVFSGYGAGGDPTAVAVVSDLYSIARSANAPLAYIQTTVEKPASVTGDFTVPHYIRFVVKDQPGIVASIAAVLAKESISLDAVLQKPGYSHDHLPFVMTIEKCSSHALNHALKEIEQFDFHVQPPLCLPIFE
jgi:homoserine dehydrogenase